MRVNTGAWMIHEGKKKEQFHPIAFFSDMFYLIAVKKKKNISIYQQQNKVSFRSLQNLNQLKQ